MRGCDGMLSKKVILPVLVLLASCSLPGTGSDRHIEDFYARAGGWDWKRLPLLDPYEIRLIDPEIERNSWLFEFKATSLLGTQQVKKVAVADSIIYLRCGSINALDGDTTDIGTRRSGSAWFVIDVAKKTEVGFPEEAEYLAYLESHRYPQPRWLDLDSLHETFGKNKKLPWQP